MTIVERLERWKESNVITAEQHTLLQGLSAGSPFSLFIELNVLLYVGILAFIGGLGWTVTTWSQQLGDVVILGVLSLALSGCFYYCFSRAPEWSPRETPPPGLVFDYVLYLGSLLWSVELTYLETRFHLLSGQWDLYVLATACFFFYLAYRFDNRFVLSLALSALAGWFGLTLSIRAQVSSETEYRQVAILYSVFVGLGGIALRRRGLKPHFFTTYLNLAANVLFWALLSGVFDREASIVWLLCLLCACGASLAWGVQRRQFSFVAYAAVYGYVGLSAVILRNIHDDSAFLIYLSSTGIGMLIALVQIARRFGRPA